MKARDLIPGILKAYGWGMRDTWNLRNHLDYDSFEDW